MSDDYGFFGKGLTGYAHYIKAYKDTRKGSGGGGHQNGNQPGLGCLFLIVAVIVIIVLIKVLLD